MKINFVGTILGSTGYDIHCRSLVNALYELNPDIRLETSLPNNWMQQVNDAELNMITKDIRKADVTIAVTQPQYWRMYMSDCEKFVGFCVWEGNSIPLYWMPYLLDKRVSQIWVPSEHTKRAILNTAANDWEEDKYADIKIGEKLKIVPHGVDLNIFKPLVPTKEEWLKEPEPGYHPYKPHKFTFICNKGWRGGIEDRGGVGYVLKADCEEFKKDENVCLLLKLNPAYLNPQLLKEKLDELKLPEDRPEIKINIDNMPYKKLPELYQQCDVYVCAQRADAFNLPGLEAMGCGLPTIQTDFGGQTDYINTDNSWKTAYVLEEVKGDIQYEGMKWAIPAIDHLKAHMRDAFTNRDKTKEKGNQALKDVQNWTWRHSSQKAIHFLKEL